jgi:hypothetical protein
MRAESNKRLATKLWHPSFIVSAIATSRTPTVTMEVSSSPATPCKHTHATQLRPLGGQRSMNNTKGRHATHILQTLNATETETATATTGETAMHRIQNVASRALHQAPSHLGHARGQGVGQLGDDTPVVRQGAHKLDLHSCYLRQGLATGPLQQPNTRPHVAVQRRLPQTPHLPTGSRPGQARSHQHDAHMATHKPLTTHRHGHFQHTPPPREVPYLQSPTRQQPLPWVHTKQKQSHTGPSIMCAPSPAGQWPGPGSRSRSCSPRARRTRWRCPGQSAERRTGPRCPHCRLGHPQPWQPGAARSLLGRPTRLGPAVESNREQDRGRN